MLHIRRGFPGESRFAAPGSAPACASWVCVCVCVQPPEKLPDCWPECL